MSTTIPAGSVVMRKPGGGRGTWAMNSLFEHLLESPPGTGRIGVALVTQPPGVATPLHRHTREGVGISIIVLLLAGLLQKRTAKAAPPAPVHEGQAGAT